MTSRTGERTTDKLAKTRPGAVLKSPPRRGGRPSRLAAEQLGGRILDVATQLFFAAGYGATSIEAVAQRARVSKRTLYHRFPDKAALFGAVVHRVVERLRPPASVPLYEGGSLEEILQRLARLMLRAALTPAALALNRLILSESHRFPELAAVVAREGAGAEAVKQIAALLDREAKANRLTVDNTMFAATQFMQMVIVVPQRRALGLGEPMTEAELDGWAGNAVNLFLNGCRGWK
jgi:AcrR family transcriptional regulator